MSSFELKMVDGKPNPKYVDLCDEDAPISGQKFACLSFVSPETILKKRELYLFEEFVKTWDYTKSFSKFFDFLQFVSYKYNLQAENVIQDLQEFAKEENEKLQSTPVDDDYKTFLDKNEERLNEQFNLKHSFQTSVRGLKIRGTYNTQEEAEIRCKKLREIDPNHDIFVGPVGMWIPWDPDAYKTGRVEFLEEELNELHKQKMENEAKAKNEFDTRVKDAKRKAIEDNIKKATDSGNTLTQTIDENNNLIGVPENVNFDERDATTVDETNEHNRKILENALKNNN